MKLKALFLCLVFVCAGCEHKSSGPEQSSSSTNRSASVKHDPCSLITKEEMAQVLDVVIPEAKVDGTICKYMPGDPMAGSAEVHTNWDPAEARAMFAAMKTGDQLTPSATGGGTQNISGLGDEATYAMSALNVRKGDAFFSIMLTLPNRLMAAMREQGGKEKFDVTMLDMSKTLAQKALTRL